MLFTDKRKKKNMQDAQGCSVFAEISPSSVSVTLSLSLIKNKRRVKDELTAILQSPFWQQISVELNLERKHQAYVNNCNRPN